MFLLLNNKVKSILRRQKNKNSWACPQHLLEVPFLPEEVITWVWEYPLVQDGGLVRR